MSWYSKYDGNEIKYIKPKFVPLALDYGQITLVSSGFSKGLCELQIDF